MSSCACGHFNCLVCATNRVGYHAPRTDLIAHLRQQIDQDPEAFLRGRLPCATAILVSKLKEKQCDSTH